MENKIGYWDNWKLFFSDKKSLILFIVLFIFLPLPVFYVFVIGLLPLSIHIIGIISAIGSANEGPVFAFVVLFGGLLHIFILSHLIRFICKMVKKIKNNNEKLYNRVFYFIIIAVVILSFFPILSVGGAGGGSSSSFFKMLTNSNGIF